MFRQQYRVTLTDGRRVEVTASAPELIRLERKYGIAVASLADPANARAEHQVFLAWAALRRHEPGNWPDFEAFLEELDDLEQLAADTTNRFSAARLLARADWPLDDIVDALDTSIVEIARWAQLAVPLTGGLPDLAALGGVVLDALRRDDDAAGEALAAVTGPSHV